MNSKMKQQEKGAKCRNEGQPNQENEEGEAGFWP